MHGGNNVKFLTEHFTASPELHATADLPRSTAKRQEMRLGGKASVFYASALHGRAPSALR